jgi:large subunit ribosomal protein L10
MLTRAQKEEQVAELKDLFGRATCIYVADYRGLGVEPLNALRRRIRREGGGQYEYRVSKNRLLKRAAEGSDVAGLSPHFTGPTAIAVSFGDPAGLARILDDFAKDHESFVLKGALLDGAPLSRGEIATLATLPSLDELRGKLVGLLQAPAARLARLLLEPGAKLARVVQAKSQTEAG